MSRRRSSNQVARGGNGWLATVVVALAASVPLSSQSTRSPVAAPPADALVAAAVKQAGAQGKSVFVEFGASWCAPCRQFAALFAAPSLRRLWAEHFVIVKITVWEHDNEPLNNPGAERLMEQWGGGRGIPYYALLDRTGKVWKPRQGTQGA